LTIRNKSELAGFAERLNTALDDLGVPKKGRGRQTTASEVLGRSYKAVRRWLEGEGWPKRDDWNDIAKKCKVRVEWLFFGLGPKKKVPRKKAIKSKGKQYERQLLEGIINAVDDVCSQAKIRANQTTRTRLSLEIFEKIKAISSS